ncbi:MAG: hypothetical protein DRR19_17965 [Candidatus Parabeggiatoa sp. nov. 1]|nr:MAG: hypothetical protein DRR19_17965 [Gammaproteobacteria bacterium]
MLKELGHTHITNFHGHIHAQHFLHPIENVSYQNVAIDVLCNSPYKPKNPFTAKIATTYCLLKRYYLFLIR